LPASASFGATLRELITGDYGAQPVSRGRHTGSSLMPDAGVDQRLRMREVGQAGRDVNDRYRLEEAHLAAAGQTAAYLRTARGAS
jgi:hypothetical protein